MPFFTETRTRSGLLQAIAFERQRANDDAVGAFALLATSTKPATATLPAGRVRIGCATRMDFNVATAKPAATAVKRAPWQRDRPSPRDECDHAAERGEARPSPPRRLAVGGEIEGNAKAEGDRQPGQQASGPVSAIAQLRNLLDGASKARKAVRPAPPSSARRRSAASHVPTRPRLPPLPLPQSAMRCVPTRACRNADAPIRPVCRRPPWRMYHANRRCD